MGFLKEKLQAGGDRPALVVSSILTAIFNTGALLLIARQMGAELLGSLAFLLAFMGMFFFLGDMGNGLAFENLLRQGYRFRDVYRVFMGIKLKLTVQMAVISGLLIALYIYMLAPTGHTAIHPVSLFIILGYFIMANLAQIWVVGLAARKRPMLAKSYDLIEGMVKFVMVGGIISLALTSGDQDAIFMLTLIYLIAGTMGMMIIHNNARHFKKGENDEEIMVEFHDASARLVPFIAFTSLILVLDKVLLWYFSDPGFASPNDAFKTLGIYFGAQRITIFIAASAVSIQAFVGGALGKYIEGDDSHSISATLRMTERYVSLVVLPVAAFYVVLSGDLLNTFLGVDFAAARITVALLAGAGLFTAMAAPHLTYLVKAREIEKITAASGLSLGIFLIGVFLLLPILFLPNMDIHGMNGTAIAMLAASVSGYALTRYYTWKLLDCKLHPRIPVHFFCAGIMIMSIHFLIWYFGIIPDLKWILAFAIIGTLVYGLALYLSGEMLKKDFTQFKQLTGTGDDE